LTLQTDAQGETNGRCKHAVQATPVSQDISNRENLNFPLYLDTFEWEGEIGLAAVHAEIDRLYTELTETPPRLRQHLNEIGDEICQNKRSFRTFEF